MMSLTQRYCRRPPSRCWSQCKGRNASSASPQFLLLGTAPSNDVCNNLCHHSHHTPKSIFQYDIILLQSRDFAAQGRGRGGGRSQLFIDYDKCQSVDEMIQLAYEHKDSMSPRKMAAFWTLVLKHLPPPGRQRPRGNKSNEQTQMQLDQLIGQTLQSVEQYNARDLSTVAISLAKIMKKVKVVGERKGSPHQMLHHVLIGNNSQNKQFILNELAAASVPILYEFDARGLSNFIYAFGLAKVILPVEDGSTFFDMLAEVAIPNLKYFNSHDLSNMLWAYANVGVTHTELFNNAGDAIIAMEQLDEFWPQALSNIVWAYVTLSEKNPKLFKKVADHVVTLGNLDRFNSQALSNIVWAYATVEVSHPKLFQTLADHIVTLDNLDRFIPQDFSNTIWAFATAQEQHPHLFQTIADHIIAHDNLNRFDPQALANTIWSYAKAEEQHPKLFKKVADHIIVHDNFNRFDPQNLSNIVWAFATAGVSHPELFQTLADYIVALGNLDRFEPQALAITVWAYATAGVSHPELFKKLADAAIKRQHEFEPQGIANFLWAFATNGVIDHHLFSSLVPSVKANINKHNAQDLANIAWSYSVANVVAPSVSNDEFVQACMKKEDKFTSEELFQLHQWQLWQDEMKSNVQLPPSLKTKCYEAFISREPEPSKLQDDVISELSSIGLQPEEEVLTKNGYRLDAVVEVNGKQVGVEVDGPYHFIGRTKTPNGSTILKHRQVTNLDGIPLVSVPYWEWDKLKKDSKKKQHYLRTLLKL